MMRVSGVVWDETMPVLNITEDFTASTLNLDKPIHIFSLGGTFLSDIFLAKFYATY